MLLLSIIFLSNIHVVAQQQKVSTTDTSTPDQIDLIDVLLKAFHISTKPKTAEAKKISFSIIPNTTSSGGKRIFVSSVNAAFVIGNEEKTNFSSVFFLPYTDLSENFGFGLKYNLFTSKNIWNIPGEFRIRKLTEFSYGLGGGTKDSDQFRLNCNNLRLNASANRKVYKDLFGGFGLAYDRNFSVGVDEIPVLPREFKKYGIGTQPSYYATGITFNLLHDDRKNSINPADGLFVLSVLRINPSWLGNEDL